MKPYGRSDKKICGCRDCQNHDKFSRTQEKRDAADEIEDQQVPYTSCERYYDYDQADDDSLYGPKDDGRQQTLEDLEDLIWQKGSATDPTEREELDSQIAKLRNKLDNLSEREDT